MAWDRTRVGFTLSLGKTDYVWKMRIYSRKVMIAGPSADVRSLSSLFGQIQRKSCVWCGFEKIITS